MPKYNLTEAKKIYRALLDAGAPREAMPLLMAQVAHETGDFVSRVSAENNNASGIMWINKPKQKNATRGRAFPEAEQPKDKKRRYYYANFATLKDWAVDYLRIIGAYVTKAKTPEEFAGMLKAKGYYTAPQSLYSKALRAHLTALRKTDIFKDQKTTTSILLPVAILGVLAFIALR